MKEALLIPALAVINLLALLVIVAVVRDIWREMKGDFGDEDGTEIEKRKNERIRKEIERWRDGL